jgi:lipopolysaccharide export system permease protein
MRTIYTHITKQILATLLLTVTVFTFVLILGNVLKEIVALLVNGQASFGLVLKALALLLPYVLVFALPIGLLTAVLLFFGRFSADQELTALRSSGISLMNVALPVLVLSLLFSGLCASINLWIGPACRAAYKDLIKTVDIRTTTNLITEGSFITEIPGYWLYVGKRNGDLLEDVRIFTLKDGEADKEFNADYGRLEINEESRQMMISLTNTTALIRMERQVNATETESGAGQEAETKSYYWQWTEFGTWLSEPITIETGSKRTGKPKISNMTLSQLRKELFIRKSAGEESRRRSNQSSNTEENQAKPIDLVTPVELQIHRQIAFSFACFSFALIGIPLGIQAHRRETTVGVALALILLAIYYTFLIVAQSLDTKPQYHPELIVWIPNFLFQGVGAFLLWKANRGI